MKYRKLKNGKYKIVDMNIITYEEVVMKYFNQNVSMETILKENEFYDEYYKCIRLINKRLRSIKEIKKITNSDVLNRLINNGYLNDLRYAKAFIHDKYLLSNEGPLKIKYKLISNDIDELVIDEILKEYDFSKKIKNTLLKYGIENGTRKLLSRGYDLEDIKKEIQ